MLMMVTHSSETHSLQDSGHQEAFRKLLSNASQIGVRVHGMYVNASEGTVFMVLEADNANQIAEVFGPLADYGHMDMVPVVDFLEL